MLARFATLTLILLSACIPVNIEFTITGTVTWEYYNTPVAGIPVYIGRNTNGNQIYNVSSTKTDSEGNYVITYERTGVLGYAYHISTGYTDIPSTAPSLQISSSVSELALTLRPKPQVKIDFHNNSSSAVSFSVTTAKWRDPKMSMIESSGYGYAPPNGTYPVALDALPYGTSKYAWWRVDGTQKAISDTTYFNVTINQLVKEVNYGVINLH
jgi:hypothetical protein